MSVCRCWGHPRAGGADVLQSRTEQSCLGSSPRWRGGPDMVRDAVADDGVIPALAGRTRVGHVRSVCQGGHPRAGGADICTSSPAIVMYGSSPRWRGGPPCARRLVRGHGVIPALAGRTAAQPSSFQPNTGHPRAGGADARHVGASERVTGSSPRWRGGQGLVDQIADLDGVIPALAGRTCFDPPAAITCGGHPRAGGADCPTAHPTGLDDGSSPRWRGGHVAVTVDSRRLGVIPALAGRTTPPAPMTCLTTGHPRAGGADDDEEEGPYEDDGSSPRWRGGLGHQRGSGVRYGVIPALAGRTSVVFMWATLPWGHPRAGGADKGLAGEVGKSPGSSPRWRGGHLPARAPVRRPGVIPALAGRTARRFSESVKFWGHPRAGGADPPDAGHAPSEWGSSPRWRGGPIPLGSLTAPLGVIPALAGRTAPSPTVGRWGRGHPRAGGADGAESSFVNPA